VYNLSNLQKKDFNMVKERIIKLRPLVLKIGHEIFERDWIVILNHFITNFNFRPKKVVH
jgi:hypothetical protein